MSALLRYFTKSILLYYLHNIDVTIKKKKNGGWCSIISKIAGAGVLILSGLFLFTYISIVIMVYRKASDVWKTVIAVCIHPLLAEIVISLMKLNVGDGRRAHPVRIYIHIYNVCIYIYIYI